MAYPGPLVHPRPEKWYHSVVPVISLLLQSLLDRFNAKFDFKRMTLTDINYILTVLQDAYSQGPGDHPCPFCLDLHCPRRIK